MDSQRTAHNDRISHTWKGKEGDGGESVSFYPPVARPVQLTYSMRELLEKAHQQDDDDLFKEEEGDDEFAAPRKLSDALC